MAEFTNQATLTFNGMTVNSNIVTGEIINTLSVTKTPINDDYGTGDRITYAISIVNSGNTALTNLTVYDNLGAYEFTPVGETESITLYPLTYIEGSAVYFINGILQPAPAVMEDNGIIITGIDVPANGSAMIIYQTVANEFAPIGTDSEITNTGIVTGESLANPVTFTATIESADEAILSIIKSLNPQQVPENGQLTYTFDISNNGNTAADEDAQVQVTDNFDPILNNIRVYLNGMLLPATAYSYNEETGLFMTDAGVITVPAATTTVNPVTGAVSVTPGVTTLEVVGTI